MGAMPRTTPFTAPFSTRPSSLHPSSSAVDLNQEKLSQRYFHSRRVRKGEVEKPWLDKKDPREKWVTIIPLIGLALGIGLAGFLVWDGLRTVVNHQYCLILDDNFSSGFNTKVWTKEAEVGGYGYVGSADVREDYQLTIHLAMANSKRLQLPTRTSTLKMVHSTSSRPYRIQTSSKLIILLSILSKPEPAHRTQLRTASSKLASRTTLSSTLSSQDVSIQRRVPRSSTDVSRLQPLYHREIGFGPPFG
jgi:hypothetical protein